MKKTISLIVMLLIVFDLASCGATEEKVNMSGSSGESVVSVTEEAVADEPIQSDDLAQTEESPALTLEEEEQRLAFGKALWDIYQRGILPDGRELDYHGMESATNQEFALTDIDGDGKEELLLKWEYAAMAGMVELVFGYQNGTLYIELSEFPRLTFYDNGVVTAGWNYNRGLAQGLWPYNVHCYDEENDVYQWIGSVEAWEKSFQEKNYDGALFPDEVDLDGDGSIYYLLPPSWWDFRYDEIPLVDGADYVEWRESYINGAEQISILYQKLTEENISALGYPKPYIELPEPVG